MNNELFLETVECVSQWSGITGSLIPLEVVTWHDSTGTVPMKLEKAEPMRKFIRCSWCGTRNPNLSTIYYCQSCGGPLEE